MDDAWSPIVIEALERGLKENAGRAVPGAKLRQLVAQQAVQRGLTYPPPGFEDSSFADFLKHFDSQVVVLRRRAQDILVAPVSRPELLVDPGKSGSQTEIRDDVFAAFVRIPRDLEQKLPWYELTKDRFIWLSQEEAQSKPSYIAVTPATWEQEVADRKAFVENQALTPEQKGKLLHVLEDGAGSKLWQFSQLLREAQLSRKWHQYRFNLITGRVRNWSEGVKVPWQDGWLVAQVPPLSDLPERQPQGQSGSEHAALSELLKQLDEQDLTRINVPLDVVLKLLRR